MYENLVAFLLGKKTELTEDEVEEFISLLVKALGLDEEYAALEKQEVIEKIVDSVSIKDQSERDIISNAIGNILEFEFDDASSATEKSEDDIFLDASKGEVPLRRRKVRRGEFSKDSHKANIKEEPSKLFGKRDTRFEFDIGKLNEDHREGPDFSFEL